MKIKKIFNFISTSEQNYFKHRVSIINSIGAKSTVTGRRKVESLKKIGREKRR
jgi:hypothetical protein